ncbi:MAG TPA: hypothetical protein PKC49_06835 [Phycisphaerae bacterium]|nr:hypothetical protein [Phycisphaerae bacterium]
MSESPARIAERAALYASGRGVNLKQQPLGFGKDGTVFATDKATAIKVHAGRASFDRELAAYGRLAKHEVIDVAGHRVPQLEYSDGELLVIEMTIVTRPFLLDFGDAYLDEAPQFPDEVIEQWHEKGIERFGAARWERVQLVIATLRGQYGVILLDVNPGNITFSGGEG